MEDIFKLRFQVYCEEKGFLPSSAYPDGLEIDEFDADALHVAVYGDEDRPKGYLRVVRDDNPLGLPLFAHGMTVDERFQLPAQGGAVEISRMMVRSDYRTKTRGNDDGFPTSPILADPPARNASDLIQLKLIRIAYRFCLENDIRWFLSAVEPSQGRKLRMMGFPIKPIGPAADYYGNVQPHAIDLREMEERFRSHCPKVMEFFASPADDVHTSVFKPGEWHLPLSRHAA